MGSTLRQNLSVANSWQTLLASLAEKIGCCGKSTNFYTDILFKMECHLVKIYQKIVL
jgi:hypothetical protein